MRALALRTFAVVLTAALWCLPAAAQVRIATDAAGHALRIQGSVVVIEPDIELSLVTAGGLTEPRKEWSEAARKLYPQAVRTRLGNLNIQQKADFEIPDDLPADSRMGQIIRLNEAVAMSISQYSAAGSVLATKKDAKGRPRMDWTLGPGVTELQQATGADYALFTYVRDSYTSGGRAALRALTMLAGFAMGTYLDIGGGAQVGVATLVDLRTGQVVWFNLMAKQSGDLRDQSGANATAMQLLRDMPR
ncbi:hypothetical protein [Lysobacter panacisoli]|uniref:DUF4410 domain-containing protein n=1 Tax=Lysobacter panacisoli TaxID=1255263 RepID=A0ABP9LPM9_9GAMM|nr:hypothetical protein [Lysobacter panacisoli]